MSAQAKVMKIRAYPREPRPAPLPHTQPETVLIVDDSPTITAVLSAILTEEYAYPTLVAESYVQCQAILAQRRSEIAVAVVGLVLPDATHGEILDLLNAAAIPIVVLTGRMDEGMRAQVHKSRVVDYILKENKHSVEYGAALVHRILRNRHTKIMVVDDSVSYRNYLVDLLQQFMLQTFAAHDGIEALQLLERHRDIQLALVDYHMPRMDGLEFTKLVRQSYAKDRLSIIVLSGEEANDVPSRMLKSGANDFIRKPFSREEFYLRIHANLEIQELFLAIREKADNDFLTGLFNRRYFFEWGQEAYEQAKAAGKPLALAAMDIDFFKKINDNHGHDVGDIAIREFARILKETMPKEALCARLGGEEFSVLVPYQSTEQLYQLFEALRQTIADHRIPTPQATVSYTISIGLETDFGEDLEAMIKQADAKLYRAKHEGRNRVIM